MNEPTQEEISEEWLSSSGFKYSQQERQHHEHWRLWLGWGNDDGVGCIQDIGIEVTPAWWFNRNNEKVGAVDKWNCWIISGEGLTKSIHVRYLKTKEELVSIVESLTGKKWDAQSHLYGNVYSDKNLAALKAMEVNQ